MIVYFKVMVNAQVIDARTRRTKPPRYAVDFAPYDRSEVQPRNLNELKKGWAPSAAVEVTKYILTSLGESRNTMQSLPSNNAKGNFIL